MRFWILIVLMGWCLSLQGQVNDGIPWYINALNLPAPGEMIDSVSEPVIIAVIDDGFRLSHSKIAPFLYLSPGEIPDNRRDDDGNGYTDDLCGWDVADGDADVLPASDRLAAYYHGTFVAGVIADLLTRCYGPDAPRYFRILPVKAVSDFAARTYVQYGDAGVRYAMEQGADLIVCAWNGGTENQEMRTLFREVHRQGTTVVASAGNTYSERAMPPASFPEVVAVAAVDKELRKLPSSNYGMFVDLSGPGERVLGAAVSGDEELRTEGATSAAVSVVAACLAILKQAAPQRTDEERLAAMKNTSQPLESMNISYAGKLGSGFPDLSKALAQLRRLENCCASHNPLLPEGTLHAGFFPSETREYEWRLEPEGAFKGIWLELRHSVPENSPAVLQVFSKKDVPAGEIALHDGPGKLFVPGNAASVRFLQAEGKPPPAFALDYYVETIDSSTLFCSGTRYYELEKGSISDGSEAMPYANGGNCKWQIRVKEGKRIRLRFSAFDTQAATDFVYLFDGESTRMEEIIGRFSGPGIPPVVTSRTNQVLVWFVTDSRVTGDGWTLEFEAVEE